MRTRSGIAAGAVAFAVVLGSAVAARATAPEILTLSPGSGPVGTQVVIGGSNFTGASDVSFGGVTAVFSVDSDTQITTSVPSGALSGPISVTNPDGTTQWSEAFIVTPAVTSFEPALAAEGTKVVITGTSFTGAGAVSVSFGGVDAPSFSVDSGTQITATVPLGAAEGPIGVSTQDGTGTSADTFVVRRVVLIIDENTTYGSIVGKSAAPYINSLIPVGKLFKDYVAVAGSSQPDYLAIASGRTTVLTPPQSNIFQAIDGTGGATWTEFEESETAPCSGASTGNVPGTTKTLYTVQHDPARLLSVTNTCQTNDVPMTTTTFDPTALPSFSMIVPNNCDNMHTRSGTGMCPTYFGSTQTGSRIRQGDAWLQHVVPLLLARDGVTVAITWDEGKSSTSPPQHVLMLEVGAGITPGSVDRNAYSHYSLEAGLYDVFDLGTAPGAGATAVHLPF